MTPAQQRRLYFPAWNRAFRAHWRMDRGRVIPQPESVGGEWRDRVWAAADVRARQHHRGVTADDLRHGCHVVALGKDMRSAALRPVQMRRVIHLFALLTNPEDLDALTHWLNPILDEREEAEWFIQERCREGYVRHVSRDLYGVANWQSLSHAQVIALARTLRGRRHSWVGPTDPESAGKDDRPDDLLETAAEMYAETR